MCYRGIIVMCAVVTSAWSVVTVTKDYIQGMAALEWFVRIHTEMTLTFMHS